jgi:hypothetical protein
MKFVCQPSRKKIDDWAATNLTNGNDRLIETFQRVDKFLAETFFAQTISPLLQKMAKKEIANRYVSR